MHGYKCGFSLLNEIFPELLLLLIHCLECLNSVSDNINFIAWGHFLVTELRLKIEKVNGIILFILYVICYIDII